MRQDQIDKLQDLSERISEVFLDEANPDNWSGAGLQLAEMDKDQRGDRYFDKKNAIQTGSLLARVLDLRDRDLGQKNGGVRTSDEDAEVEIKRFEKQAKELLNAVSSGAKTGMR
jgi:hypothetical protein